MYTGINLVRVVKKCKELANLQSKGWTTPSLSTLALPIQGLKGYCPLPPLPPPSTTPMAWTASKGCYPPASVHCRGFIYIYIYTRLLGRFAPIFYLNCEHVLFVYVLKQRKKIFADFIKKRCGCPTQNLGSAVLTFIGYKQTDRQAKFIYGYEEIWGKHERYRRRGGNLNSV